MNAKEIRETIGMNDNSTTAACAEIAAQLAELNRTLSRIAEAVEYFQGDGFLNISFLNIRGH